MVISQKLREKKQNTTFPITSLYVEGSLGAKYLVKTNGSGEFLTIHRPGELKTYAPIPSYQKDGINANTLNCIRSRF